MSLQAGPVWTYGLSPIEQYGLTAAIILVFALVTAGVYSAGGFLKQWMDEDSAEAVQAIVVTAIGIVAGVGLVFIWQAVPVVGRALRAIDPSSTDAMKLLITVLAFGVAYTATRITKRFVRFGEGRDAITNHQREILHHVTQIVVFLPAVLFAFALWGASPENLLLSASVLGVVLGLAARQTLGAVLAGFVLLFSRPFEVGDWVEIDDNEGVVTDISIVNTQLQTFDDEMVMLPNDQITDSAVVNRSRNDRLRVQVDVGVDYGTDVGHAMQVAVDAMQEVEMLMDGPEPDAVLEQFGDSAVVLNLRFWISNPTIQRKWAAQNAVMEAVKTAFESEDISIPFPQRVLSGREQVGGLQVTGDAVDARDGRDEDGHPDEDDAPNGEDDAESVESAVEPATDGGDEAGGDAG